MEKDFPRVWRLRIRSHTSSISIGFSGMRPMFAPPAIPAKVAIQPACRPEGVLSSDGDQGVESQQSEVPQHLVGTGGVLEGVGPGGSDDRSAGVQYPRDCLSALVHKFGNIFFHAAARGAAETGSILASSLARSWRVN